MDLVVTLFCNRSFFAPNHFRIQSFHKQGYLDFWHIKCDALCRSWRYSITVHISVLSTFRTYFAEYWGGVTACKCTHLIYLMINEILSEFCCYLSLWNSQEVWGYTAALIWNKWNVLCRNVVRLERVSGCGSFASTLQSNREKKQIQVGWHCMNLDISFDGFTLNTTRCK